MADQTRFRSPQRDPGSLQASSGAKGRFSPRGEDPLAELARLIGQDDPFSDFRNDPRGAPHPTGNGNDARNNRRSDQDRDYDERGAYGREPQVSRARRYADDDPRHPDGNAARRNGRGAYAYGGAMRLLIGGCPNRSRAANPMMAATSRHKPRSGCPGRPTMRK
jgi:hypothetical protein